jgi:hypothetical protein
MKAKSIFISGFAVILAAMTTAIILTACGGDKSTNGEPQPIAPAAPTNLTGSGQSSTSIQLNWNDNSTNEYGFYINRRNGGSWSRIDTTLANATTYLDTGLEDSTTYYYTVESFNNVGVSPSTDTIPLSTLAWGSAPEEPSNPSPSDQAVDQPLSLQLSWTCSDPDGDPLTYDLYFGPNPVPPIFDSNLTQTTYDISGLELYQTYYWRIDAKDTNNHVTEGPWWSFSTLEPAVTLIGQHDFGVLTHDAIGMWLEGNYAYVANGYAGLHILSVSNPANPALADSFYIEYQRCTDVEVRNNHAYVTYGDTGLVVLNVTNPANPTLVGHTDTQEHLMRIALYGDYAYTPSYQNGLMIFDISDSTSPDSVGVYQPSGEVYDIVIDGVYGYITVSDSGLMIIDLTTPTSPTHVGTLPVSFGGQRVVVNGNYAYFTSIDGMHVVDISNPAAPAIVSFFAASPAVPVAIEGTFAYVGTREMTIIDVTDPATPKLEAIYDVFGSFSFEIIVSGGYIYYLDYETLRILQYIP